VPYRARPPGPAFVARQVGSALTGTRRKLGAVFGRWVRIRRGTLEQSASDLAPDDAGQLSHSCISPEVFRREGNGSIVRALVFYEPLSPAGASEDVLLESVDQRVSLVSTPTSANRGVRFASWSPAARRSLGREGAAKGASQTAFLVHRSPRRDA